MTHQQQQQHLAQPPDQKYDRQLRLWGVHGQKRLSLAHVCLANASATGTESLKNLVLPGIGKFTVLDASQVGAADLASNFFVSQEWLGKSRALACAALLMELNPDVQGRGVVADAVQLARSEPTSFAQYSLVIATQMDEAGLLEMERACVMCDVPLIVARTNGLLGHVRVYAREHRVVESKPSPEPMQDLRICNPFPQLRALVDACQLQALPEHEFGHTPYVVLLVKALDAWRAAHGGHPPATSEEKRQFVASVKALSRGAYGAEENVVEAAGQAFLAYAPRPVPDEVALILADPAVDALGPNSANFWVLANALKAFVAKHGVLPLPGALPDMTSTTASYVALQRAYRDKAMQDLAELSEAVDRVLLSLGRSRESMSSEDRALFCASAYHLHVSRYRTMQDEFVASPSAEAVAEALMEGLGDGSPQSPILWYIMWRAADAFFRARGVVCGADDSQRDADQAEVLRLARRLATDVYQLEPALVLDAHALEMVRYAGCEPHSVAALVGGIASQEAVKLLTAQYVPLNNTFFFNGIAAAGAAFKL